MSPIQQILQRRAAEDSALLLHIASEKPSASDLAAWGRITLKRARRMLWVVKVLGRALLTKLTSRHLSYDEIDIIASGLNKLTGTDTDRVKLVDDFCEQAAKVLPHELEQHVKQTVATLTAHRNHPRLAFNKTADANNHLYFQGAGPAELVAAVETELVATANALRTDNMKFSEAMFHALVRKVLHLSGKTTDPFLPYRNCYVIVLDPTLRYHADGKVMTTTGTLVDVKDLVNQELQPYGYAVAYALSTGGDYEHVGTYGVQRFFNQHQRFVGSLEHPICAYPGCDRPAKTCQAHHVQAAALGGPTLLSNYAPLCAVHNGQNDDDPSKPPKNGRIEFDPATRVPGLRRFPGDPLRYNLNPVTIKGIRRYLAYLRGEGYAASFRD